MSSKIHFKDYNPKQILMFPQRIDEDIEDDAPVRVINAVIDSLKLENIRKKYKVKGQNPYHPKMMLKAIIYGYMNNIYSCRKIEEALKRDIHFIWLAGYNKPDFNTINRFRNRVKDEINNVFTQIVLLLAEKGYVTLDVEYIDGTKIESKANKYTFVWRKSTETNKAKLLEKIRALLGQVDDAVAQENAEQKEEPRAITAEDLRLLAQKLNEDTSKVTDAKEQDERRKKIRQLEEHAEKLQEYEGKLETLGDRNSYSKTDKDATFMRMKEDAMNNGQTKPGYNLQIGTENQFILDWGLFQCPGDPTTMIPFFNSFFLRYLKFPTTGVADSGYGSEENYHFMEEAGIEAYVKYNMFHKEHRKRYVPNPFSPQALFHNVKDDYYVCPMGQHMNRIGTTRSKTDNGYIVESARYQAQRCEGCPLRGGCFKGKGNRVIEVNHTLAEYRRQAAERLTSEQGVKLRGNRCIEPEAVFGQMKYDMGYKRFRHFGLDKVKMDFAFFAIAFNLKKMCSKMAKTAKSGGNPPIFCCFVSFHKTEPSENRLFLRKLSFLVA